MNYFIGCDAHKNYSEFVVIDEKSQVLQRAKVIHRKGAIKSYLQRFPEGTQVALETVGNYYWIVDEIEEAGCNPLLAHAAKAKLMMGNTQKNDKLDGRGLATLLRNGTLPVVWMPPGEVRDERELPRTRMFLASKRASIKNRLDATFSKYGINFEESSDLFSGKGREVLASHLCDLPPETRRCVEKELVILDCLQEQIEGLEERIREMVKETENMRLLKSLP